MANRTLTETTRRFLQAIFPEGTQGQVWLANGGDWGGGPAAGLALDPARGNYWSPATMKAGAATRSNAMAERVYAVVADDVGAIIDPLTLLMELPEGVPAPFKVTTTLRGSKLLPGKDAGANWRLYDETGVAKRDNQQWGWRIRGGIDPARLADPTHYMRLPQGVSGKNGSATVLADDAGLSTFVDEATALEIVQAIARATPGGPGGGVGIGGRAGAKAPRAPGHVAQKATLAAVQALLDIMDNSVPGKIGYDDWIAVGISVWGSLGEAGREAWVEWSWKSPICGVRYDPDEKWRTFPAQPHAGFGALEIIARRVAGQAALSQANAGVTFDDGVDVTVGVAAAGAGVVGAPVQALELQVAEWIAGTVGSDYRYDAASGLWLEFVGDLWRSSSIDLGFRLGAQWVKRYGGGTSTSHKASFASGVSRHLRNMPAMVTAGAGDWDRGPWLAGVPGGVFNLRTGAVRPARASDMITRQLAAAPTAVTECPVWLRFVWEACRGDVDMVGFLQRWMGYCLTGDVREQKFFYVWGPGENGKSKFMDTHRKMMGTYAVQARSETFIKRTHKGHPEDIARMAGARLVVVPEISGGDQWDVDLLKEMTGNATMTARHLYKGSFEFPVTFKLASHGNHQPAFPGGVNAAVARRLIYAKFENKPKVKDDQLEEKFAKEMGGIVAWALEGLREWQRLKGLCVPKGMQDDAGEYLAAVDPVLRWQAENLEQSWGARTTMGDLFKDWEGWCRVNKIFEYSNLSEFSKMIRAKGLFSLADIKGVIHVKEWKIRSPF